MTERYSVSAASLRHFASAGSLRKTIEIEFSTALFEPRSEAAVMVLEALEAALLMISGRQPSWFANA